MFFINRICKNNNSDNININIYEEILWKDKLIRFYESLCYTIYGFFMLTICTFLFIWLVIKKAKPKEIWFTYVDAIINILFIIEVCFRLIAFGKAFFKSISSVIDFVFCIILTILFFLPMHKILLSFYREELVDIIFLLLRYFFYFVRILRSLRMYVIKNHYDPIFLDFQLPNVINEINKNNYIEYSRNLDILIHIQEGQNHND